MMRTLAILALLLALVVGTASAHPKSETLPFARSATGWILIHAKINGNPGVFVFDTGAVDCFASPELIGEKNVGVKSTVHYLGGKQTFRRVPATVSLGENNFGVDVLLGSTDDLSALAKTQIDGIIGLSVLSHYEKITIDFKLQVFTLEAR